MTVEEAKQMIGTILHNMLEEDIDSSPYHEDDRNEEMPFRYHLKRNLMELEKWCEAWQPDLRENNLIEHDYQLIFAFGEGLADAILEAREREYKED